MFIAKLVGAALTAAICIIACGASAQSEKQRLYIIYDSSNSMWTELPGGARRYEAARAAIGDIVNRDLGERQIALRVYGHRRKNDCRDSQLLVPFSAAGEAGAQFLGVISKIRPTGRTPIDLSLRQALTDFGGRSGSIILISDGIESCDADPCALVKAWGEKNIDIKVHVVGLGLTGKARAAMQCISDAAGTPYRDAFSTGELIDSLDAAITEAAAPVQVPAPNNAQQNVGEQGNQAQSEAATIEARDQVARLAPPDFALVVETEDGARQRGVGQLVSLTGAVLDVDTFARYTPEPGAYSLLAGVRTVDDTPYEPQAVDLTVKDNGRTVGRIIAPTPPQVSASFSMEGEDLRSTVVTVFRDGKKLGSFKGDASAFLQEGTYEFRSKLAGTSKPLVVTETFARGDAKTISFNAELEVRLNVFVTASSTGERLGGKPTNKLMRNGELIHKVNRSSGGLVTPGTYMLAMADDFNIFETELTVTREALQEPRITVPAGALTVNYLDASGAPEASKRVFIRNLVDKGRGLRRSGETFAVLPGRYLVTGWPAKNGYPDQEITIEAGETQVITLKATK
ncbi:MAG: hypothetical protein AAFW47_03870 [Pseudomonadota bacterium]